MNQEQKTQFSLLVSELNMYLIKITNIVYKINSAFSKIYSIEDKSTFNFLEQMTELIKDINNNKTLLQEKSGFDTYLLISTKKGDTSLLF